MHTDEKIVAPEEPTTTPAEASIDRAEPPRVYLPACGALCDVFWWARRTPDEPK